LQRTPVATPLPLKHFNGLTAASQCLGVSGERLLNHPQTVKPSGDCERVSPCTSTFKGYFHNGSAVNDCPHSQMSLSDSPKSLVDFVPSSKGVLTIECAGRQEEIFARAATMQRDFTESCIHS